MISRWTALAVMAFATCVAAVIIHLLPGEYRTTRSLIVLALTWTVTYVAAFATRHWWDTHAGRALMIKALGNLDLLLIIVVGWAGWLSPAVVDVGQDIGFVVYCGGIGYLTWVVLRTPRLGAPAPQQPDGPG